MAYASFRPCFVPTQLLQIRPLVSNVHQKYPQVIEKYEICQIIFIQASDDKIVQKVSFAHREEVFKIYWIHIKRIVSQHSSVSL